MIHEVCVEGVPAWMDIPRLLGTHPWAIQPGEHGNRALAALESRVAADLEARLRGLGFGGRALTLACAPALPRALVRAARTDDARRRRDTSPGFARPGARLDEEGRWSLTPEALALAMGRRAARVLGDGAQVLDAGCGAGGNAIGFARAGLRVIAFERDARRAEMARHNAALHGVSGRVTVVCGDAEDALASTRADLAFVDPPWGEAWDRVAVEATAFPLVGALQRHRARFREAWAKLPPSGWFVEPGAASLEAWFGVRPGDLHRVKFVLARISPAADTCAATGCG
jgi:SAM-dependent methyltransferase